MIVRVRKTDYTVSFVEKIDGTSEEAILWGECNVTAQTIKIKSDLQGERLRETLVHELTHAYHFEYFGYSIYEDIMEFLADFVTMYAEEIVQKVDSVLRQKDKGMD
jgi:hypothetical protein